MSPEKRAAREQKVVAERIKKLERKRANTNSYLNSARKRKELIHDIDKALDGNTNKGKILKTQDIKAIEDTALEDLIGDAEVIFKPNDGPQTSFFESNEREVLYGGAAGGGKSYALIVDAVRDAWNKYHRAIIFRKTLDELRELIGKSKDLYPQMYPGCTWNKQESTWSFPSGATIWYTYLESEDDVRRYQGQAFNYIGFDELTQWNTPYAWDYLRSRLRTTAPDLKLFMRATTNPGGVGTHWVRKMFIDPAPPDNAFWATDIDTGKPFVRPDGTPLFKRRFIPARLSDNPFLYESGEYEDNLRSLPEAQRRQLLEGDWDVVEGAAFPDFSRSLHVCKPFKIPEGWTRFRAADYGYSSPSCVLWIALDHDGRMYVYRELYGAGMDAEELATQVKFFEEGDQVRYGVLDSSVWDMRGQIGPSIAETMNTRGLRWRPASKGPGSRVAGKVEIHRRMKPTPSMMMRNPDGELIEVPGEPMVKIFENCVNLIRTLPTLPTDKHNPEDVDTNAEDHAYDALRYGIMSRPMRPDFGLTMSHKAVVSSRRVGATHGDNKFGY